MLIYLAFVSVLLLIPIKDYKRQLTYYNYTDSNNGVIDVNSYCYEKPCLVKCCNEGESLNALGECIDTRVLMADMRVSNYVVQRSTTNDRTGEVKTTNNLLKENFVFVHTDKFVNTSISEHWDSEFYIFEDGSLKIIDSNDTSHSEVVSPLDFCLDYRVVPLGDKKTKITFLFKLAENRKNPKSTGAIAKAKVIALGLLITILVQTVFVCVLPKSRAIVSLVKTAFVISLVLAYLLEMVQLLSPTTDYIDLSDCRLTSPAIYFFTLSNFFWVTALMNDVWCRIRNTPLLCDNPVKQESDRVKFLRYCLLGWAAPLLITLLALAVDLQRFGSIIPIIEPPFESCFADERQTTIYLYIPVALLSMTTCVLLVLYVFGARRVKQAFLAKVRARVRDKARKMNLNIVHLERAIQNLALVTDKSKLMRIRFGVILKLLFMIGLMVALQLIPGVPLIVHVVIILYSVVLTATIVWLVFFERSIFITPCKRLAKDLQEYVKRMSLTLHTLGLKKSDIEFEKMDDSKEIADDTTVTGKDKVIEVRIEK